jgi:hypothetical protein
MGRLLALLLAGLTGLLVVIAHLSVVLRPLGLDLLLGGRGSAPRHLLLGLRLLASCWRLGSLLLCLCSLCLSSLGRVQLLVVGCPGSLVVGVCLLLALGGVLAGPGSCGRRSSRSSVHGSLWGSKHLCSLVGTARSILRGSTSARNVLILLSNELLGQLDLLGVPANVEQFLVRVGLGSPVQLHVGT